jgi:hypothetical protein
LIEAATECSGKAQGVFVTLNPVNPVVMVRSLNRARSFAKHTTKDAEIAHRWWLPLDFDPKRPPGISSTNAEHDAAIKRARECRKDLRRQRWPDSVLADSGNGAHLLVPIILPNDERSTRIVKELLNTVADRFSDDSVVVDRSVYNAARLWKLYGTLASKGSHTIDRPHRLACILEVPTHA